MELKSKEDLVKFVKHQTNVELTNDPNERLNKKRNLLYTEAKGIHKNMVLRILNKYGIRYEHHLNDKFWVYIN